MTANTPPDEEDTKSEDETENQGEKEKSGKVNGE